jgi:hypothetical protein
MGDVARYITAEGRKEVNRMNYERPEVLATYTEQELAEEAAVCVLSYGPNGGGGGGGGGGN